METQFGRRPLIVGDRTQILSAKFKTHPALFWPVAVFRETNKKRLVKRDTDIVIEGLNRSANHFAVYAFQYAQKRPVNIANHFHAPAQLILAARWGIPALCLIRDPLEYALSEAVYKYMVSPKIVLQTYKVFYTPLLGYLDRIVVADMHEVTTDFGRTIARINARFGTSFDSFTHDEKSVAAVQEAIRGEHSSNMRGREERDPLPSKWKDERKAALRSELEQLPDLLSECRDLYARFVRQ